MVLKCVAIDDEPLALVLMRDYIGRMPDLKLQQTFDDAITGSEFLRNTPIDLLFIDINMPDITGVDVVRSLPHPPMIIFTTAHKNYAYEGFELNAIDYLLKPISFERFSKAVKKAIEFFKARSSSDEPDALFVYSEYRMLKILFGDIEYIESLEDYCRINLVNAKPVLTLMTLKKVVEKLPASKFKRIHRSYIVAVEKVKAIHQRKIQLASGVELPVSDSYISFVKEWPGNR